MSSLSEPIPSASSGKKVTLQGAAGEGGCRNLEEALDDKSEMRCRTQSVVVLVVVVMGVWGAGVATDSRGETLVGVGGREA